MTSGQAWTTVTEATRSTAVAYLIGQIIGAILATLLFSRLFMWLTNRIGDNTTHILVAHGLCYLIIITLASFGFANGGPPDPTLPLIVYTVPQLLWLAIDVFALKGRRIKAAEAQ
jgi:hypothetical protein